MVHGDVVTDMVVQSIANVAVSTPGPSPLQIGDAMEALFASGLGTIIQFVLFLMAVGLSIGALFMLGAAGFARQSGDASTQSKTSEYLYDAVKMLAFAAILGAGPAVLAALGFETMTYIDPINVFSGG